MTKQAFLVQHVGPKASRARSRADRIMNEIVKPACERTGYNCVRADNFPIESITEPIVSALAASPLVIADLGSPPWNHNVLMEIGFRLATGKPMVYLADIEPSPDILPLHLQNKRVIQIQEPIQTIDLLSEYIQEQKNNLIGWKSHYPTIEIKVPLLTPEKSIFTYVNEAAAQFYGYNSEEELLSVSVGVADAKLQKYMDPSQAKQFVEEQERLFGVAVQGRQAVAAIPAWFTRHPNAFFNRKAFWPILLSQKFSPHEDQSVAMRVAFVNLSDWFGSGQPRYNDLVKLPDHLRPRSYDYDIFLSYNSKDRATVAALAAAFKRFGLKVWYDEDDLVGQYGLHEEIKNAMYDSRILVAIFGTHGLGPWQENEELRNALLQVSRKKRAFSAMLLNEVNTDESSWVESLPPDFRDILEDKLYVKLPKNEIIDGIKGGGFRFIERIITLFATLIKQANQEDKKDYP